MYVILCVCVCMDVSKCTTACVYVCVCAGVWMNASVCVCVQDLRLPVGIFPYSTSARLTQGTTRPPALPTPPHPPIRPTSPHPSVPSCAYVPTLTLGCIIMRSSEGHFCTSPSRHAPPHVVLITLFFSLFFPPPTSLHFFFS